jgi:hypothetical protein
MPADAAAAGVEGTEAEAGPGLLAGFAAAAGLPCDRPTAVAALGLVVAALPVPVPLPLALRDAPGPAAAGAGRAEVPPGCEDDKAEAVAVFLGCSDAEAAADAEEAAAVDLLAVRTCGADAAPCESWDGDKPVAVAAEAEGVLAVDEKLGTLRGADEAPPPLAPPAAAPAAPSAGLALRAACCSGAARLAAGVRGVLCDGCVSCTCDSNSNSLALLVGLNATPAAAA